MPSIMEELIRHTRTSYAGLAMSNKESWREEAKGTQDDEVGTCQNI